MNLSTKAHPLLCIWPGESSFKSHAIKKAFKQCRQFFFAESNKALPRQMLLLERTTTLNPNAHQYLLLSLLKKAPLLAIDAGKKEQNANHHIAFSSACLVATTTLILLHCLDACDQSKARTAHSRLLFQLSTIVVLHARKGGESTLFLHPKWD